MAIGDIVKVVLVRLRTDGAAQARADMTELAARARELGQMDPTIKVKIDRGAFTQLRAMKLELDALGKGDSAGLYSLAQRIRAFGDGAGSARLKVAALALEMDALKRAANQSGDSVDGAGNSLGVRLRNLGGIIARLFGQGSGGGGVGGFLTSGGGIGLIIAAIGSGILGLIPDLAAAAAGVAAFGGLALPTFTGLTGAISALSAATSKYQTASQNLDTAIRKSPADWAAYQKTIQNTEPDLRDAARLLTNQNATWQQLTPSMQKSLTALRDNAAAYKALLPDQQKALNALLAQRDAWTSMTPAQQQAATAWAGISASIQNMEQAVAPLAMQIINDLLRIAQELLPAILPLATAAGNALVGLFGHLADSLKLVNTQTTYFRDRMGRIHDVVTSTATPFGQFVKQMTALAGPSISVIGEGLGKITIALGKFLIALANPNSLRAAKYLFDAIAGMITFTAWTIRVFTEQVTRLFHQIAVVWDSTRHWANLLARDVAHDFFVLAALIGAALVMAVRWVIRFEEGVFRATMNVVHWFEQLPGRIIRALAALPGLLFSAGQNAISHLISGLGSMLGALGNMASSIVSKIAGFFGLSPAKEGPLSGAGSMEIRGQHMARDLARGMASQSAYVGTAAGLMARSAVPGYGAAGAPGGGVLRIQWVGGPSGALEQAMWTWFRERVRITGGGGPQSVQRALGVVWR